MELNEQGYIITDASRKTSADGVYAAGDVCIKPLRQVVTATREGALAATELEKYVAAIHRRTGLRADAPAQEPSEATVTVDTQEAAESGELFTAEMRKQLDTVFTRMDSPLLLKLRPVLPSTVFPAGTSLLPLCWDCTTPQGQGRHWMKIQSSRLHPSRVKRI